MAEGEVMASPASSPLESSPPGIEPPAPASDQADSVRFEDALQDNATDLLAYLLRRIDRDDAPDVLGEVFATAWRRRGDAPDDIWQVRMWLFGIARKSLANARRTHSRRFALVDRLAESLAVDASYPGSEDDERAREVRDAVADLPGKQRELVRLVHWDGFTLSEAAEIAGIRPSTARTHYARARQRLAHQLGDDAATPVGSRWQSTARAGS